MKPVILILLSIYIVSVLAVLISSLRRRISRIRLFFISLFLTPVAGSVLLWAADKKIDYEVIRYKCKSCGYTFTENHENCPICEKDGHRHPLKPVKRIMT